jgi:hypothetical protein
MVSDEFPPPVRQAAVMLDRQTPARCPEHPHDGVARHGVPVYLDMNLVRGYIACVSDAVRGHHDCDNCDDCGDNESVLDRSVSAAACMPPAVPRRNWRSAAPGPA